MSKKVLGYPTFNKVMSKKNKSKFLAESEAQAVAIVPTLDAALFDGEAIPDDEKAIERLNLPTMLKPDQVPVWSAENPKVLRALVVKIVDSPKSDIKGKLLWLRLKNGTEITFPCTGVIRNALAPGIKADDDAKLTPALEKFVGETLIFRRTPNRPSKYKKAMFMFDVLRVNK